MIFAGRYVGTWIFCQFSFRWEFCVSAKSKFALYARQYMIVMWRVIFENWLKNVCNNESPWKWASKIEVFVAFAAYSAKLLFIVFARDLHSVFVKAHPLQYQQENVCPKILSKILRRLLELVSLTVASIRTGAVSFPAHSIDTGTMTCFSSKLSIIGKEFFFLSEIWWSSATGIGSVTLKLLLRFGGRERFPGFLVRTSITACTWSILLDEFAGELLLVSQISQLYLDWSN